MTEAKFKFVIRSQGQIFLKIPLFSTGKSFPLFDDLGKSFLLHDLNKLGESSL